MTALRVERWMSLPVVVEAPPGVTFTLELVRDLRDQGLVHAGADGDVVTLGTAGLGLGRVAYLLLPPEAVTQRGRRLW